jgi:hypothetical protein
MSSTFQRCILLVPHVWNTGDHAAEDPVTLRELSLTSYLRVDDISQAALGIFSQAGPGE